MKARKPIHQEQPDPRIAAAKAKLPKWEQELIECHEAYAKAKKEGKAFFELPPGIKPNQIIPRDHDSEDAVKFPSGATMSPVAERFDLICPTGLRRLAARYALGAEKHGDINWCLAGDDPAFQRARLNHLIKHVAAYLRNGNADDDNLAAIAWGAFALMHYEESCRHHEQKLP